MTIYVTIIDDIDWNPDLEFLVELYDVSTGERLPGDDTQTRVTIIDDD